ncbi:MAG TPA: hypothetical protein VGL60_04205 [Acidimicrobiales bacterium]
MSSTWEERGQASAWPEHRPAPSDSAPIGSDEASGSDARREPPLPHEQARIDPQDRAFGAAAADDQEVVDELVGYGAEEQDLPEDRDWAPRAAGKAPVPGTLEGDIDSDLRSDSADAAVDGEHHRHEPVLHRHRHSHVTHNYNEATGGFDHLSSAHEHDHRHPGSSHSHRPHEDFELEHGGEGHDHDHDDPTR